MVKMSKISKLRELVKDIIENVSFVKKRDSSLNCDIKIIDETHFIDTMKGKLSNDKIICIVEGLDRIAIKPEVYYDNGKNLVYLPDKTHGQVRINVLKNFAKAIEYKTLVHRFIDEKEYKDLMKTDNYIEIKTYGTINWNMFDNDFSPDFSAFAHTVTQSKVFQTLKDTPAWKTLLIGLTCFALGIVVGFFLNSLLNILLNLIIHFL